MHQNTWQKLKLISIDYKQLIMSSRKRFEDVLKKFVTTSISDQSKTFFRPKLRRFYDVFTTSSCRLGVVKSKYGYLNDVIIKRPTRFEMDASTDLNRIC